MQASAPQSQCMPSDSLPSDPAGCVVLPACFCRGLQADLAYNVTLSDKGLAQQPGTIIAAHKLTTSPSALRVLFMPEAMVQRTCDDDHKVSPDALVVHCQSPKSGQEKEAYLKQLQLWRQLPGQDAPLAT